VTKDRRPAGSSQEPPEGSPDREEQPTPQGSPDHGERSARGLGRMRGWAVADPLRATAIAVTVIAAVCAAWFGGAWLTAADSGSLAYSRSRDAALQAAEQEAVNLNTLNYHHAQRDLELWLASSTAALHAGLAQNLQQEVQLTQRDRLITSATILDGAVTRLDATAGTASVMIALRFTVTISDATPATKFESELGQLKDTASGWKLSGLCPTSGCTSSLSRT
jgi:Mce-associated membrane protein